MLSSTPRIAALVVAILIAGRSASAQLPRRDEPSVCLGFSFGPWTPALDWRAAGHGVRPDSSLLQRAASGRDWATAASGRTVADSLLILFPSWWPAGVAVELPTRAPAPGDTITGKALAFVADGRVKIPTSRVRAWRVPC